MTEYNPEEYWSNVGQQIQGRGENYVAGDNNPYFDYKRQKFLNKFLGNIEFGDKVVMELGFGPGGNLKHIAKNFRCRKILGADISETMLELATENMSDHQEVVSLCKTNGRELPFESDSIDLSFTVTVLHHITDEAMFSAAVRELCRVTSGDIVLMEDVGNSSVIGGSGDFIGRRIDVYRAALRTHGFELKEVQFLKTRVSRAWHDLLFFKIYKPFINKNHREGEPTGNMIRKLIGLPLFVTRHLDEHIADKKSLAKMVFRRPH